MQHIDAAGKDIIPGAFFVYATRIADRSHLQFGRVVELKQVPRDYGQREGKPKIGAITVQLGWRDDKWEATGKGRVQTIERLDAVLVVPRTTLHPAMLAAIEPAYKQAKAQLPRPIKVAPERVRQDNASGPDATDYGLHSMVEGNRSPEQC